MGFVPQMRYRKSRDTKAYHTSVSDASRRKTHLRETVQLYIYSLEELLKRAAEQSKAEITRGNVNTAQRVTDNVTFTDISETYKVTCICVFISKALNGTGKMHVLYWLQ